MPTLRRTTPGRDLVPALRDLARERAVALTVRGGCMAPLVADGERVAVAPARRYWPGDVLVFRAVDGRLLAHRLLGYRLLAGRLALVTRGDGCCCADAPVPPARVLGRVTGRAPEAGEGEALPVRPAERLRAAAGFLRLSLGGLRRRFARFARWA
jgi:hypothetical protein